ncbi:hypothetical protein NC653_031972 [Populus alba x Populus x berolinensis]|uniref:Uncharacterized protein n=1 Tax=Populus alba x Populus x berolinensis TaxID=444605 RepID=A0AAD6M047_9ROSI|nr:hypothetical protein NC653_031972 [Populus alba x Populus x berolinensis]
MNSYQAGRGQQKEATISYHSCEDRQPKRSSKKYWNITPNQQATPLGGKLRQASATPRGATNYSQHKR